MEKTKIDKIVYSPKVARELLKRGYRIVDIKPDKYDEYHKASIFVFKNEATLEEEIFEIANQYSADKNTI
jgi:predicted CoA-binding protein